MKVLIATYYEFLKNLRDIKMAGLLIIFPIITTVILGTAVEGYFSKDSSKRISIGYVNLDGGATGKAFDVFLDNEEIRKRLEVTNYSEVDQGQKAMEEGKINALIYLPIDLSQKILEGETEAIQLYGNKDIEFVESIVYGFTDSFNATKVAIKASGTSVAVIRGNNTERIDYNKNATKPRAIDYYAVLELLQVLIIGAIFGVFITTKTFGSDIHIRIHSLPVSRWTLLGGQVLGSILYLFLAATVTVVFTKIVYGVNWNGNPLIMLLTIFIFCCISIGIGALIGIYIPSFSTALMIIMLMMIFFGILSGSVSPQSTIDAISFLIPNYHAKILLFGTIYGYSNGIMLKSAFWLLGMSVVIYGLVTVSVGRRKYDNI